MLFPNLWSNLTNKIILSIFEKSEKFDFSENFKKFYENAPLKNFFFVFFYVTWSNQHNLEQKDQKKIVGRFGVIRS